MYEEGRVEALVAKVIQREKDGTAPARGEYDELYEELSAAQRNHSEYTPPPRCRKVRGFLQMPHRLTI